MAYPSFTQGENFRATDANAIGLWLVKTQTIGSAVASVTVTSAFSADYDNYIVTISGGVASTNIDLRLQLGASTTGYYGGLIYHAYGTAGPANAQAVGVNNGANTVYGGSGSTSALTFYMTLIGPNLAKNTGYSAQLMVGNTAGSVAAVNGFHNVATAYTDFTILASTGTMTGGTIRVYGMRN